MLDRCGSAQGRSTGRESVHRRLDSGTPTILGVYSSRTRPPLVSNVPRRCTCWSRSPSQMPLSTPERVVRIGLKRSSGAHLALGYQTSSKKDDSRSRLQPALARLVFIPNLRAFSIMGSRQRRKFASRFAVKLRVSFVVGPELKSQQFRPETADFGFFRNVNLYSMQRYQAGC
jgi:hypothetical protein